MDRPPPPETPFMKYMERRVQEAYTADQMHAYYDSRPVDCRTCEHCFGGINTRGCGSVAVCDGGDRYDPLPVVQLWRKA